ncbi:MAG: acetate kinase, partial [Gammaproteobacteria bacterium]|nr:acetate kinase [Gammaproteobacteria bacterium]
MSCYDVAEQRHGAIQILEGNEEERLAQFISYVAKLKGISAVLHRVVHAGYVQQNVARVSGDVVAAIRHWNHLAPLHNGLTLRLIDSLAEIMPEVSQFAVFDSGLYAHLPKVARCYALPADLDSDWPVSRYGFHGLAHLSQ